MIENQYRDPTAEAAEATIERAERGRANRESGKLFEQMIEAACVFYEQKVIAKIDKTPEPMRIIKSVGGGRFEACFTKRAQPDFKGVLNDGREVCFEAKHTTALSIAQSVVNDRQGMELDTHYSMKAFCFVVVGLGNGGCYRVPWDVWRNMYGIYGHKHMTDDDLEEYRLQNEMGKVMFLGDIGK